MENLTLVLQISKCFMGLVADLSRGKKEMQEQHEMVCGEIHLQHLFKNLVLLYVIVFSFLFFKIIF